MKGQVYYQLNQGGNTNYTINVGINDDESFYIAGLRKHYKIDINHQSEFDGTSSPIEVARIVEENSGQISTPTEQTINNRTYSFAGWSDGVISNPRIITPNDNATYTAFYKLPKHSNNSGTNSNNSQQKFVRMPETDFFSNGILCNVYESMEKIWLEKSTDNGANWQLANGGAPISYSGNLAKSPSMCLTGNGFLLIAYQEAIPGLEEEEHYVTLKIFNVLGDAPIDSAQAVIQRSSFSADATPVITFANYQDVNRFTVVWKVNEIDSWGMYEPGLYYRTGSLAGGNLNTISLHEDVSQISSTNGNSFNPSIESSILNYSIGLFHLLWEQRASDTQSAIYFGYMVESGGNLIVSSASNISDGCGYENNRKPSVTYTDGKVRASWIGTHPVTYINSAVHTSFGGGGQRRTYYGYNMGSGNDVNSVNINKVGTINYVLAYAGETGLSNKYIRSTALSTIKTANTTGGQIQTCNGSDFASTYLMSFSNSALPYYFSMSNSVGNMGKENTAGMQLGRSGIVSKENADFLFMIGDIKLNGQTIEFREIADSNEIFTLSQIREYLETKPFVLSEDAEMYFSVLYGTGDSASVKNVIDGDDYVKYAVELVENSSGNILGKFDEVTYNKENLYMHNTKGYKLNTAGMEEKTVKLRLKVETNLEGNYGITDIVGEEDVLGKVNIESISYQGNLAVKDYALSQNYPNPFNPSTTIYYQLITGGKVSLKVYDILGKEVITLVDKEQESGKYQVTFDGSKLSSGVYICRITAGEFVKSIKMNLIK